MNKPAGRTRTPMRLAFESARVDESARRRPRGKPHKRSLSRRIERHLNTNSGIISHRQMWYVTRVKG